MKAVLVVGPRRGGAETRFIEPRHMDIQIRQIRPDEWRASVEFLTAFGSNLAQEQMYSDEVWRERALGASSGCDRVTAITGLANQFTTANGVPLTLSPCSLSRPSAGATLSKPGRHFGLLGARLRCQSARSLGDLQQCISAAALYERCHFRFSEPTSRIRMHLDSSRKRWFAS